MAGFLSSIFGAKPKTADPDPVPGIGGYGYPRGPIGSTGYPGSTSVRRTNPREAWKWKNRGTPYVPVQAQQIARQDQPGEWHGGVPMGGTLSATGVGEQYQDTEQRQRVVISQGIPGGLRQRNTTYYGGVQARPNGTNRYVFGGPNGGVESYTMNRRMPYTAHGPFPGSHNAKHIRGADLSGARYTSKPPIFQPQNDGFGKARTKQRHRPTVFAEPAPWSSQFYDTTATTGAPDSTGATSAPVSNVYVSPSVPRSTRTNWRRSG